MNPSRISKVPLSAAQSMSTVTTSAGTGTGGQDSGGSAAETFAIGFALGGTLLLVTVIVVLVLQNRKKNFKTCFRKASVRDKRLVSSQHSSKSLLNNGRTAGETFPNHNSMPLLHQSPSARTFAAVGRFSSTLTHSSLNCFGNTLPRSESSSPPEQLRPDVFPQNSFKQQLSSTSSTLPAQGQNSRTTEPEYTKADAMYRLPVDALQTVEEPDPHDYADPDTAIRSKKSPPPQSADGVEAGLEYGSVSVVAAQEQALLERRLHGTRPATMHFEDPSYSIGELDGGPYRTTDLVKAHSLTCVRTASTGPEAGLYLVRSVTNGSWNRRTSTHSASNPPAKPPTHRHPPMHNRSSSTDGTNSAIRASLRNAGPFRSLESSPLKAASMSNLDASNKPGLPRTPSKKLQIRSRQRPSLPVIPNGSLLAVPLKPPRVKHVDPNYIFVKPAHAGHNPSLRTCKSVPTRLHKAHKRMSSNASAAGPNGQVTAVVDRVPALLTRLASSEQIGSPDITQQQPYLAEPLVDHSQRVLELKEAIGQTGRNTTLTVTPAVVESAESFEADDDIPELIFGTTSNMGRRSSSLPDLSQLIIASAPPGSRVKDRWAYRMSAVAEGSREESDSSSRQASLEHSFQQFQARRLFTQQRGTAVDENHLHPQPGDAGSGDARDAFAEPTYWVLEVNRSQSIGSA